jgi:hypothetical protein
MDALNEVNGDRYSKIVAWAKKRYTVDGMVVLTVGGIKGKWLTIEEMAFRRYLA